MFYGGDFSSEIVFLMIHFMILLQVTALFFKLLSVDLFWDSSGIFDKAFVLLFLKQSKSLDSGTIELLSIINRLWEICLMIS